MLHLLGVLVVVYQFGDVRLVDLPPERVLPVSVGWSRVPDGWDHVELPGHSWDVICAESATAGPECVFVLLRSNDAGVVFRFERGGRFYLANCRGGLRDGVVERTMPVGPSHGAGWAFRVHGPTPGRSWWDAWCWVWR